MFIFLISLVYAGTFITIVTTVVIIFAQKISGKRKAEWTGVLYGQKRLNKLRV